MLNIPLSYNIRNLKVRKVTTLLTVLGIGLVVAIFLCVMALAEGLANVFRASGEPENVLTLRKNAQAELQSIVTREQASVLSSMTGIDIDENGAPLVSPELIYIIILEKRDGNTSNITMRGLNAQGIKLRPKLKITEGRMFEAGKAELIVSNTVAKRFKNADIGQTLSYGPLKWEIVGKFDAQGTAPSSEIWGDVNILMSDFKRNVYQSILFKSSDRAAREQLMAQISGDPQLKLDSRREMDYYAEQTKNADPIKVFGMIIAVIMAIGACFGAMNTMYATISSRTREIATLRAIGFSRRSILISFILESTILGMLGGIVGCGLGFLAIKLAFTGPTGTFNFATFSEVVFSFRLTPNMLLSGFIFSVVMGFFGGLLPAAKAAFTKITLALRQVN